jgi:hypothetical protein
VADKDDDTGKSGGNEPASESARMLSELTQMRSALTELKDQQVRYLWILFPIGALLAIQTILQASNL